MKFASIFNKSEPSKTITKKNGKTTITMYYAFSDLKGNNYYHYNNAVDDMNYARYALRYLPFTLEYGRGLHKSMVESLFDEILHKLKTVEQIRAAVSNTKDYFQFDADLYIIYKIMAILYLKEDEENLLIPDRLIEEKAEDIRLAMESSMGADSGFFLCGEFRNFLTLAGLLDRDWTRLVEMQEKVLKTMQQTLALIREKIQ